MGTYMPWGQVPDIKLAKPISNTMLKHLGVIGARSPYKQIKKVGSSVRLLVHILCVACIDHLDRIAFDDVGVVPLVGDTYTVASS